MLLKYRYAYSVAKVSKKNEKQPKRRGQNAEIIAIDLLSPMRKPT